MTASELVLAAGLDWIIGDPRWLPHPVRAMGQVIAWCDDHVRAMCQSPLALRLAGVVLALGLPTAAYLLGHWIVAEAGEVAEWFGLVVTIGLASSTLAGRDLWDHVQAVAKPLLRGDLVGARQAVAMIVGRDTHALSESEVVRATVETVAESTADGVIAPLFYLMLGGPPLALAYKAVNTLDSMVGHRDERHVDFGWASARLDDLANWIPARLAAVLLLLATGLVTLKLDRMICGWQVLRRDGGNHPSPNSGRPEAAMAGALGVQLGGTNYYEGIANERPTLGDGYRALVVGDITLAAQLMGVASLLGVLIGAGVLWLQ
ncbi:adenosylcobinamide-phosphate synthase CbiB [Nitrospira lenta]|uniref:Cobalamin biosynthesis protein CobD n=1 Tax=Nitrospira lenta TaxID=1436998 RepID=A0A330LB29_9BACT|nr:adenosylcobinamide-phosphate synthase CbiB [Nitrospira lenta]SPP66470.1 Cobalamin biosynthesis protein CbiB [Nitrospira lenta]